MSRRPIKCFWNVIREVSRLTAITMYMAGGSPKVQTIGPCREGSTFFYWEGCLANPKKKVVLHGVILEPGMRSSALMKARHT